LAVVRDEVDRALALQRDGQELRVGDVDVGVVAVIVEMDAAGDDLDEIGVALDGVDRRTVRAEPEHGGSGARLKGPDDLAGRKVDGADNGFGMVGDEEAMDGLGVGKGGRGVQEGNAHGQGRQK
jgi:hypothetical protein